MDFRKQPYLRSAGFSVVVFLTSAVFLYGYVYAAYKYGNPLFGRNDFFKYQMMVGNPFDFAATTAPFVLRQLPAVVGSIFYKLGAHYDTKTVADLVGLDHDAKRRFLALILSNAFAVCLSLAIVTSYLRARFANYTLTDVFAVFGIYAAWFYFASGVIAPVTVGWGWLVSSIFVIAFLERRLWVTFLACLTALLARETTLIFALAMFMMALCFEPKRDHLAWSVVVLASTCFLYLVLRISLTSGYEYQIEPKSVLASLSNFSVSRDYLFQSILSQGLLAILLFAVLMRSPRQAAYLLVAAFAVWLASVATRVSQAALVMGETLPFYAVVFLTVDRPDHAAESCDVPQQSR